MPPFNPHPVLFAVLLALGASHTWWVGRGRARLRAVIAWVILAVVSLWPVGDLRMAGCRRPTVGAGEGEEALRLLRL